MEKLFVSKCELEKEKQEKINELKFIRYVTYGDGDERKDKSKQYLDKEMEILKLKTLDEMDEEKRKYTMK